MSYINPLCQRYSSQQMQELFSQDKKFSTWRKLWICLAEAEKELGLDISDEQIAQMKQHIYDIDYDLASYYESKTRHDVMAHIKTFGDACPLAKPIIHLGATSCFVGDNTDLIIYREGLIMVKNRLIALLSLFYDFIDSTKDQITLAYTHFQPAQPTTLGKRATLWAQDLMMDLERLDQLIDSLKLLGCKGTTGTGSSFLELLGSPEKVQKLENIIAQKMGFSGCYNVSGQTYSRKIDYFILSTLSGIAQSATKFATDIRLLSHLKEVEEPFESEQVGSSAMAYKRNPMRSERICSLSRLVISQAVSPAITASNQWLERTLDDSANRRIVMPEAFLAIDGALILYGNVLKGLKTNPFVMQKHLNEQLPFMATENIMMHLVKKGYDRQVVHEKIRQHSVLVNQNVNAGGENDLIERIISDQSLDITKQEMDDILNTENFIGLAKIQASDFMENCLKQYKDMKVDSDFKVSV